MAEAPLDALLAGLRARDAERLEPVRWRRLDAFARRAAPHAGEARRVLDARLVALATALDAALDARDALPSALPEPTPAPGPLAAVAALSAKATSAARPAPAPAAPPAGPRGGSTTRTSARTAVRPHAPTSPRSPVRPPAATSAAAPPAPADVAPPEHAALDYFRRAWSKLSAEQRLAQSLASLPQNAGPLNSQHLLHRALTTMRDVAPAYLEHFLAQVDALQWLDAANVATGRDLTLREAARGRTR